MPYQRILLAVDPEGLEEAAFPIVAALAEAGRGHVTLLAVSRTSDAAEHLDALQAHLQKAVAALEDAGVQAKAELRQAAAGSSIADEITAAAELDRADLVALGSHGHGALAAVFVGSVGREVSAKVQAPVLFVHKHRGTPVSHLISTPLERVLVPVDHSEAARRAIRVALEIVRPDRGSVLLLHVREMVPRGDVPYIESAEEAYRLTDGLLRELSPEGVKVEARVAAPQPNPASAIAEAADEWGADLIVFGSRRLTPLGGLLLGSVAQAVLHRTDRPVLLAGHPTPEPPGGASTPSAA